MSCSCEIVSTVAMGREKQNEKQIINTPANVMTAIEGSITDPTRLADCIWEYQHGN